VTTLTLIESPPEQRADWILDQACKVAVVKFRAGQPATGRMVLDSAADMAGVLLGEGL
jgi:hypothetical protein